MKKSIKASKFETKVCLIDKYDNVVCELERDGGGFYVIPRNMCSSILFDIGDEYHVDEIDFEVD